MEERTPAEQTVEQKKPTEVGKLLPSMLLRYLTNYLEKPETRRKCELLPIAPMVATEACVWLPFCFLYT